MTTPIRTPGRHGRRAPSRRPAVALRDVLRAGVQIPPHPVSEDYLSRLSNWQVLGNMDSGDCVGVTWANERRLVTATLTTEQYPTLDQVYRLYQTQNPDFDPAGTAQTNGPGSSADSGMDIQTCLEYLVKTGGPDGVKALAFAKVDYTNQDEFDAALAIFGCVWLGANLTQANMDQFSFNTDWDYVSNSPVDGGHSVVAGGYGQDVRLITWGAETGMTPAFQAHQVEEAWVVIWPEHLGTKGFEAGIDQAALAAAYQELTGQPFPVGPAPVPTPRPPSPANPPDAADLALVASVGPWANDEHLTHGARAVAQAIRSWRSTKGL